VSFEWPDWGWHKSEPMVIRDDGGLPVATVHTEDAKDARLMAAAPVMRKLLEREHATVGCGIYFDGGPVEMCPVCAVFARIEGAL